MRICMFVYNPLTNDSRVFREAGTLAEQGHSVDLIGLHRGSQEMVEERDGFTIHRIQRNPIHLRARRFFIQLGRRLRRASGPPAKRRPMRRGPFHRQQMRRSWVKQAQQLVATLPPADVYHAHDLNTLSLAEGLARGNGAPLVYDAHELFPETVGRSLSSRLYWRARERRLIRKPDAVIAVSDARADRMAKTFNITRPTVIRNCPPAEDLARSHEELRAMLLEHSGLTEDAGPVALYQGRFSPGRGLDRLVAAAKQLDDGVVVLMGWGGYEDELRRQISAGKLDERVRIAEPVPPEELVAYTAGAAVGVIPIEPTGLNNYFAAPNKLFEYMAAGLPIVASRLPETIQFVEGCEVGLTCEPGNVDQLADAINRLLGDAELRERFARNSTAASKTYNWQEESKKLLSIYDGLKR